MIGGDDEQCFVSPVLVQRRDDIGLELANNGARKLVRAGAAALDAVQGVVEGVRVGQRDRDRDVAVRHVGLHQVQMRRRVSQIERDRFGAHQHERDVVRALMPVGCGRREIYRGRFFSGG